MKKWNEKTTFEKTMDIISGVAIFVWLVLEWLENLNKISQDSIATYVAAFVVCVCEAISFWNVRRVFSYVAIAGAVLLIAVSVLIML